MGVALPLPSDDSSIESMHTQSAPPHVDAVQDSPRKSAQIVGRTSSQNYTYNWYLVFGISQFLPRTRVDNEVKCGPGRSLVAALDGSPQSVTCTARSKLRPCTRVTPDLRRIE